jgi:hypothetical protein
MTFHLNGGSGVFSVFRVDGYIHKIAYAIIDVVLGFRVRIEAPNPGWVPHPATAFTM